jgi:RecQ family ATP-dependent DNA helicase
MNHYLSSAKNQVPRESITPEGAPHQLNVQINLKPGVLGPTPSQIASCKNLTDLQNFLTLLDNNVTSVQVTGSEPQNLQQSPARPLLPKDIPHQTKSLDYANVGYWNDDSKFNWSDQIKDLNWRQFGNKFFRTNQKAIINCVLSKQNDVFV